ncbi:DUF3370 family protein [Microcoleus sp. herbarium12]
MIEEIANIRSDRTIAELSFLYPPDATPTQILTVRSLE